MNDEVLVFHVDLDAVPDPTAHLAHTEHDRAARFVFPRDGRRWAAARSALRAILGYLLGRHPASLAFRAGPHGKPALADPETDLQFNLSHSGGFAIVAAARGRVVGVDLECVRPIDDADEIVARHFAPAEARAYERLPAEARSAAFLRAWVRKEAVLKAIGAGLSQRLADVDRLARGLVVVDLPSPEGTLAALATGWLVGRPLVSRWIPGEPAPCAGGWS